jgi:GNAT superfamily N-acetyltransferase
VAAADLVDAYERGFRVRLDAMRHHGQELVEGPGILALIGTRAQGLDGRALVTGDSALPVLSARLPDLPALVVTVFAAAEQAHHLLAATGRYRQDPCTAMVHGDLGEIPDLLLPDGLTLCPVDREGSAHGVSIEEAATAAMRSDPTIAPPGDADGFVTYLRSVPNALFLAAIDEHGDVRATAATAIFGRTAGVFFVNTDPAWRGHGVGTAMTAAALRAAFRAGAGDACLDASALGLSLYLRLGFRPVSAATLFVRRD